MIERFFFKPVATEDGFESHLDAARAASIGFMLDRIAAPGLVVPIEPHYGSMEDPLTASRLYDQAFKHHVRAHIPVMLSQRQERFPSEPAPRSLGQLTLEMVSSEFLQRATIIGQVLGDGVLESMAITSDESDKILHKSRMGWEEMLSDTDRNNNQLLGVLASGVALFAVAKRVQAEPEMITKGLLQAAA